MKTWASIVKIVVIYCLLCSQTVGLKAGEKKPGSLSKWSTQPSQLSLDVAVNQSVLMTGQKQKAYLRVGLRGFPLDDPEQRAPVNIAIVIDKSGSMSGQKIKKAKEAAIMAIQRLNSRDIISVVTYDSTVNVLIPATKVSDRERIFRKIRAIRAGGSTALFAGVSKGAAEIRKFLSEERVNRLVLLSDGLANVGPSSPAELGDLGASMIKEGVSATTIGLGTGYNEDLMTKLAYKSDGSHYFAEEAADLAQVFNKEFGRALSVVAQEVRTEIQCAPGIRPIRVLGREAEIDGQTVSIFINQIYSEHEKFLLLEFELAATEEGHRRKVASVAVRYDNLKTHTIDRLTSELEVNFTPSKELAEKSVNAKVMVDVVEMIAVEQNELAMRMRDQGKIKEAREILIRNQYYLGDNARRFKSKKLDDYARYNYNNSSNLDEANWNRERKSMQEEQSSKRLQR